MREDLSRGSAHAPFRAVARHRIADLSARGKPDARTARRCPRLRCGLQHQTWRRYPAARSDAKKIAPQLQRFEPGRQEAPIAGEAVRKIGSRRQTLAALCAACCQNPTAGSGRHSRPETVAPLANELARLVRAFHDRDPDNSITVEQTRLYSEPAQPGQRRLHGMRPTIRDVLVASGLSGGQGRAISGAVTSREVG